MKPCLPVEDLQGDRRARRIADARLQYRWNYEYLPPLPLADEVPRASKPHAVQQTRLGRP